MDKAKAALSSYLKTEKIILSNTKSKIGAMIYTSAQVTDLQHLTSLVEAVKWSVSVFGGKFDVDTGKRTPVTYYLGPPNTSNQLDPDDFVSRI
jgi:hypothetical protein